MSSPSPEVPSAGRPAASESPSGSSSKGDDAAVGSILTLSVDRVAKGGAALGLAPDGRVTFVEGAIPGERVEVEVTAEHPRRLEAATVRVLDPAPGRRRPPCPMVAQGCGGCDWQHVDDDTQRSLRRSIVADALRRLGGIDDVDLRSGPALAAEGYRTTVRVGVLDGRAAYRRRSSNGLVAVDRCLIAHPLVEEILIRGRFPGASEVTVRVGARTGERLVIVDGPTDAVTVPDRVEVVAASSLSGDHHHHDNDHGDHYHPPHIHEVVGGIRLQISAGSFFQCRPDGAEALASLVGDALADHPGTLLDAYGGVGLFGALAGMGREIIGVESNPVAAHDAAHNYGAGARVVTARFEQWQPEKVGVAVADPARAGLKAAACDRLAATDAAAIALVSCDPAALARDAALLQERGYTLDWVSVVDLFGQTSHVETVSRFVRR